MGHINVDDLCPGMVLARDLTSPKGRMLAPQGCTLEEKHIRIMKIWGVTQADIKDSDQQQVAQEQETAIPQEVLDRAKARARLCFSHANTDHPAVAELFRLSVQRVATVLATGKKLRPLEASQELAQLPTQSQDPAPQTPLDMVRQEIKLSSFPEVYHQILDVIEDPKASSMHVAEVVGRDTSMAAKLLRMVNSPFYGFPSAIDSLTRAVTIIGVRELTTLALGISALNHFSDIPPDLMDMQSFWRHSLRCAICAKVLAGHKPALSEERFFVAGLIHDIGRLVMLKHSPRLVSQALQEAMSHPISLRRAEEMLFGYDHAMVTGALLSEWRFPDSLAHMAGFHHFPGDSPIVQEAAVIHVADMVAHAMTINHRSMSTVPTLHDQAWQALDLPVSVLAVVINQTDHLFADIEQTLLVAD
ncbi:MAG: HDOD domain-containing protein [Desulfovibrio sp.]|nr:MAG: HDOD domain-containing protein [Desulfovibrio sp.]